MPPNRQMVMLCTHYYLSVDLSPPRPWCTLADNWNELNKPICLLLEVDGKCFWQVFGGCFRTPSLEMPLLISNSLMQDTQHHVKCKTNRREERTWHKTKFAARLFLVNPLWESGYIDVLV